jgi:hypothetical protein
MQSHAPEALTTRLAAAGLDWIVPQWPVPSAVQAFVTTRNGGVSGGASASLDLGSAKSLQQGAEVIDAIAQNRQRVEAFLPAKPVWLEQVHGADVVTVRQGDRASIDADSAPSHPPRGDAAVTRAADVVLGVRVADCLPVLFADRDGSVVGIAHAGWRGLAAGVLENTVAAMQCEPTHIVAWFGPAIGPSAFEVGDVVRDAFMRSDVASTAAFVAGRPGKWYADLEALARRRLARVGVTSVHGGDMCTLSDSRRFFSFRRDGTTARMAAFVWRAAQPFITPR